MALLRRVFVPTAALLLLSACREETDLNRNLSPRGAVGGAAGAGGKSPMFGGGAAAGAAGVGGPGGGGAVGGTGGAGGLGGAAGIGGIGGVGGAAGTGGLGGEGGSGEGGSGGASGIGGAGGADGTGGIGGAAGNGGIEGSSGAGGEAGGTGGQAGGTGGQAGGAGGTGGQAGGAGTGGTGEAGAGGQAGAETGGAGGQAGGAGAGGVGGQAGEAGAGGIGGQAGGAGAGGADGCGGPVDGAEIVSVGQNGAVLLRGMVVTPDQAFAGEVLVQGDTLTCVGPTCASAPGASSATVVETHGIILPGLVDVHNHILFDIFDETHWTPAQLYTNHDQWVEETKYDAMLDAKQFLNSEGNSPMELSCELDKFGELKGLVGGSTTIVGHTGINRTCYGSLARTAEQASNGLGFDKMQVSALFPPTTSSANGVCANFLDGDTTAYLIHCGEGVDAPSLAEFAELGTVTTDDGCLYAPQTTLVHATAFGDAELTVMAERGMSLGWSARVNVFLYGGGTDLTKNPNIPLALQKGINVALGPDWSIGGSQNLLDEMRFADHVDNAIWDDVITPKMLVQMATKNGAKALGLGGVLGSLEAGKKADLFVIGGDGANPYDAVLAATPADVRLVMVGGVALYGDPSLAALGPASPGCEAIDICCRSKFACVASTSNSPNDKFGQTYAEIRGALEQGLAEYDAMQLSPWVWSPMTDLVRCP
jgi:5-methylthioadenosine/S-adenosylhomocysteine deaminase